MKPRYIVLVLLELLLVPRLPMAIIAMIVNLCVVLVADTVERENRHDAPLTTGEKWMVIPLLILNLVIADAFFYFCWKKRLPTKASQSNRYAFVILCVWLVVFAIFFTLRQNFHFGP